MFVCIKRTHLFGAALAVMALFCFAAAQREAVLSAFSAVEEAPCIVVIDAGHGGEDGGAVSADGVAESRLNLAIAKQVNAILRFSGRRTKMTRTEDLSLSEGGDTLAQRKRADLKARVQIANATEGGILLSIHQNSLPSSPITHGAQVFWNRQEGAEALAAAVQSSLNRTVNTDRAKEPRPIQPTIYVMKKALCPAILVECGFLTNPEETERLLQPSYQRRLAVSICAGMLSGKTEEAAL